MYFYQISFLSINIKSLTRLVIYNVFYNAKRFDISVATHTFNDK